MGEGRPERSFFPVAVEPAAGAAADIAHRMEHPGRYQYLLADGRVLAPAVELQFHFPLHKHKQFSDAVGKIFPALARGIDPQSAGEAPPLPVSGNCVSIYSRRHRGRSITWRH